jgi:site-specific DNA recombinase
MSFKRIAVKLSVGAQTVRRAYDHARPEAVREAAERGELPRRGQYSHLGEEVYNKIRELLSKDIDAPAATIAAVLGCGASTVNRERRKMKAESQ